MDHLAVTQVNTNVGCKWCVGTEENQIATTQVATGDFVSNSELLTGSAGHITFLNGADVAALALTDDEILFAVEDALRAQEIVRLLSGCASI